MGRWAHLATQSDLSFQHVYATDLSTTGNSLYKALSVRDYWRFVDLGGLILLSGI